MTGNREGKVRRHIGWVLYIVSMTTVALTAMGYAVVQRNASRRAQAALALRLRFGKALAECSRVLFSAGESETALSTALQAVRDAAGVQEIRAFENVEDPEQGLIMRSLFGVGEGGVCPMDCKALKCRRYEDGFRRWAHEFAQGRPVAGQVSSFPETERHALEAVGVKSIALAPVWSGGRWWGFIALADARQPRVWHERDLTLVQTTTLIIGAYFELCEANRQLEEALAQARLKAEEAQAATVAKGQFLANMSHEIRTPLNGIIATTSLLVDMDMPEESLDYFHILKESGEALLALVNNILDFSKLEAGKVCIEEIGFDLRTTVEEAAQLLIPKALEKGLEMPVLVRHNVPARVVGDPARLRQILLNLLGNAIKFTERGEAGIQVSLMKIGDEGAVVGFEVFDTGIGIPAEQIDSLFEAFTQADPSTSRKFGGTGLGLSICRELVEAMGGAITIQSTEGVGTTFFFSLPFKLEPGLEKTVSLEPAGDLQGAQVVIADESRNNRIASQYLLEGWGCTVRQARDGAAALRELESISEGARILLVSNRLGDMPGHELVAAVRERPGLEGTRIVWVTSAPERGDARRMLEQRVHAYLVKPIEKNHLHDALATILHRDQAGDSSETAPLISRHTLNEKVRAEHPILLVEDMPLNQKVASGMLERLGYHCDLATNGHEALEAIKQTDYHLVLMDCQMPEMDGYEATRLIRAGEENGDHIPIVAMTAGTTEEEQKRCKEAGMTEFLPKPIDMDSVAGILRRYVGAQADAKKEAPARSMANSRAGQHIDFRRINYVAGENIELKQEIIQAFLDDVPKRIAHLKGALNGGDMEAIHLVGHTLKGSSANLGACRLRELGEKLERAGKTGDTGEASELLPEIQAEFECVKRAFTEYLGTQNA